MADEWDSVTALRHAKVAKIFERFDANKDGGLDRYEMAALVIAVNPKVKFKDEQIQAILDEVFKTYGEFIETNGLSLAGLQRTYDDGAGDVDRDFSALRLQLDEPPPPETPVLPNMDAFEAPIATPTASAAAPAAAAATVAAGTTAAEEDKGGYEFASTKRLVDALEQLLQRQARSPTNPNHVSPSHGLSRGVAELRDRADSMSDSGASVEAHLAMGRILLRVGRADEALPCFKRAAAVAPGNVRAQFLLGNAWYSLGKVDKARDAYVASLEAGKADPEAYATIMPQVHVNLGITLEAEGLLMNACDHYREAALLNPQHHHAMKLLGSALYGLGEHRAAEEALQNALFLNPDFADAHCDLGSALHALGDDARAGQAFERALAIDPQHVDAMYNYAGLLRDTGQFDEAAKTYAQVLQLQPAHWQAQLNRSVSLLGAGQTEAAARQLESAYRQSNRVELYDAVQQLKRSQKDNKRMSAVLARLPSQAAAPGGGEGGAAAAGAGVPGFKADAGFVVLEPGRITVVDPSACLPKELAVALDVRAFQKHTRLSRCSIDTLRSEFYEAPTSDSAPRERMLRRAAVETLLRKRLLPAALPPDTFAQVMRALNEKVLSAVESAGVVDLGLFLALTAILCDGPLPARKAAAFEALQWRRGRPTPGGGVLRRDAEGLAALTREVYLPGEPPLEDPGLENPERMQNEVKLEEFNQLVDKYFPIMYTLRKLEMHDKTRHVGMTCTVCKYSIVGLRFREPKAKFDLCSQCYSERKVPVKAAKRGTLAFAEYVSGTDVVRERLGLYGRTLSHTPTTRSEDVPGQA